MVGLAGCSGDGSDDSKLAPSTETSAKPEDEAIDVVKAYWDERIRVENSADYDSADFEGILDPELAEDKRALYDHQATLSLRREGVPDLRNFDAAVDGSTAVVTFCLNEGSWTVVADVQSIEQPPDTPIPVAVPLEETDGEWLMTSEGETAPVDVTC